MRIALIDPSLFTAPYDAALAAGLRSVGHEVSLHARRARAEDAGPAGQPVTASFYPVASLAAAQALPRALRLGIKGLDHIVSMNRLGRRLRQERPDVIHFQWLPLPMVDRHFLPTLRTLAPLVLTVHDSNPFNGNPAAGLQRRGAFAGFRHFDRLIVHTAQGRQRLCAHGVAGERIAVVPHGLLARPHAGPAAGEAMDGEITFLLFGKIKPYKGADLLIAALARLAPQLRNRARVHIIGQPYMDLAPLHQLAQRLGVAERVTIAARFVPEAEIPTLFGPGTIAAFPYREIEASGVLSLAVAHARPVLASRLGGFGETIRHGEDGLLVPPDDVAALTDAMARFLAAPAFAAACARAIATRANDVPDWTDIARLTTSVYDAAARSRATGPLAAATARAGRAEAPPPPPAGGHP
ncbi:MAG: glycosyltransferase family 4 protein [Rhodospirillales bacterium]|nr:glycosyltransferase family 4 protein [Rhodospirillales bacterium]